MLQLHHTPTRGGSKNNQINIVVDGASKILSFCNVLLKPQAYCSESEFSMLGMIVEIGRIWSQFPDNGHFWVGSVLLRIFVLPKNNVDCKNKLNTVLFFSSKYLGSSFDWFVVGLLIAQHDFFHLRSVRSWGLKFAETVS